MALGASIGSVEKKNPASSVKQARPGLLDPIVSTGTVLCKVAQSFGRQANS